MIKGQFRMNKREQQTGNITMQKRKRKTLIGIPELLIIVALFLLCITMQSYITKTRLLTTQDIYYVSDEASPAFSNVTFEPSGDKYTVKLLDMFSLGETTIKQVVRPTVYLGKDGVILRGTANMRVINGFSEDSYAEDAGLQIDDIITHINGVAVTDDTLTETVKASENPCTVRVMRGEESIELSVPLNNAHLLGVTVGGKVQVITGAISFVTKDGEYCAIGHTVEGYSSLVSEAYQVHLTADVDTVDIDTVAADTAGVLEDYDGFGAYGYIAPDWIYGQEVELGYAWEIDTTKPVDVYVVTEDEPKQAIIQNASIRTLMDMGNNTTVPIYTCTLLDGTDFISGMSGSPVMQNGRLVGVLMALNKDDAKLGYFIPVDRIYDHFIGFESVA